MAGEIVTKKITELEENTTIDDTDILMAGDKGTNALKRFTIGAFLTAIKAKLAAWTFDTLQTTSKTLPGAVNELNSKIEDTGFSSNSYTIELPNGKTCIIVDSAGGMYLFTSLSSSIVVAEIKKDTFYTFETDVTKRTITVNRSDGQNGRLNIIYF